MPPAEKQAARDKIAARKLRWLRSEKKGFSGALSDYVAALEVLVDELTAPDPALRPSRVNGMRVRTTDQVCSELTAPEPVRHQCERQSCRHSQISHLRLKGKCVQCSCVGYQAPDPEYVPDAKRKARVGR